MNSGFNTIKMLTCIYKQKEKIVVLTELWVVKSNGVESLKYERTDHSHFEEAELL